MICLWCTAHGKCEWHNVYGNPKDRSPVFIQKYIKHTYTHTQKMTNKMNIKTTKNEKDKRKTQSEKLL